MIRLIILALTLLPSCWWWHHPPTGGGSGGSGGNAGSSGTGGSVLCQSGDSFAITCAELPGGTCGAFEEPLVVTLPIGPDEYCSPASWVVTDCVLEMSRTCGPPEQYAEQSLTAELWEGGSGTQALVLVDTLNYGTDCVSEYECVTEEL
jgi:hypothetical protein